ncbi:MAG: tRNA dihydrouridine synthase DusB, partial [Nanoarchaeota archaeon]
FIFTQINDYLTTGKYQELSPKKKIEYFFSYLKYAKKFPSVNIQNIKIQAMNFSKGCPGGKELRAKIIASKEIADIEKLMKEFYGSL